MDNGKNEKQKERPDFTAKGTTTGTEKRQPPILSRVSFQILYRHEHVLGPGRFDVDDGTGAWLADVQRLGVKGGAGDEGFFVLTGFETIVLFESREPQGRAAVEAVADHRQAQMLEMRADLMKA